MAQLLSEAHDHYVQIIERLSRNAKPEPGAPTPPWDDVYFQYLIVKRLQGRV